MPFVEHDVSQDRAALQRLLLTGGHAAVPTIAVGRQVLVGFDAARLDRMIDGIREKGALTTEATEATERKP